MTAENPGTARLRGNVVGRMRLGTLARDHSKYRNSLYGLPSIQKFPSRCSGGPPSLGRHRTFDRLFAGIRFDEADGHLLFAYAKDEETASEIEDKFTLHISIIASKILGQQIEVVLVLPKVLQ